MADSYWLIAVAAISTLISILTLTVALDGFEIYPVTDFAETEPLSRDAIYLGGATIIGLAAFGSVIGTSIVMGSKNELVKTGVTMIATGTAGVIGAQGFLMFSACCWIVHPYIFYVFLTLTLAFAIMIIFGYGYIIDYLFKHFSSKPQKPK